MGKARDFVINIVSLKNGDHEFSYQIDDTFFKNFENSIVDKGSIKVDLNLHRSSTFIKLDFKLLGTVELICDRSLDAFDFPVESDRSLLLKFGEEDQEIDDEILMIQWNTQSIDVAQFIYEFIGLEVPMKRLHPRYEDEDLDEEDDEFVYQSADESDKDSEDEEKKENPIWGDLKDLLKEKNKKEGN